MMEGRDAMLEVLRALVEHETPSRDKPALDAMADVLATRLGAIGGDAERIPNRDGGDHVRAVFPGTEPGARPTLVLGHFDTVWPRGTLARRPFRVEGDRAYGPGVYDMKAGLVITEWGLRRLHGGPIRRRRPVVVLWTSDEEIGSPTSRTHIEAAAREAAEVLVLEPPLAGGRLKTARKGIGHFVLGVHGKAAHAGVEPEKGASAIVELAHQVLAVSALGDAAAGTTVNVGVVRGGTVSNVVPEEAEAVVDARVWTAAEAERIEQALRGLRAVTPGTSLAVSGRFNRPPMERSEGIGRLFERTRRLAAGLGVALDEGSTGGGSDANFTAALGVPTLDGLGCDGRGAHAEDEQIELGSLTQRAALLGVLLAGLDAEADQ